MQMLSYKERKKKSKSLKKDNTVIQFSNPVDQWEFEGGTAHTPPPGLHASLLEGVTAADL